jgi:opacity protein-like surface antigen
MLKVKVLSLAAAMLLPLAVNAQPAAQDWELTLGGQGQFQSDFKGSPRSGPGGAFGAQIGLGYYLNDNIDVGVRQALNYVSNGTWAGATRAFIDYNIIMDRLVPFIGGNIGYQYGNRGLDDRWVSDRKAASSTISRKKRSSSAWRSIACRSKARPSRKVSGT